MPLEPDGLGSHCFRLNKVLLDVVSDNDKTPVAVKMLILKQWTEPDLPSDMIKELTDSDLLELWNTLTTKAHWAWLRWIRSTHSKQTRSKRIKSMSHMLTSGKRRPCCFDSSKCSQPYLSKNGIFMMDQ